MADSMDELERARNAVNSWHLGQTSERYESSGVGAGTISTGRGDHGGVSYGAYQLSKEEGTLAEYLRWSRFGTEFKGLTPDTPAFDARWREVAQRDPGFKEDQHKFIGQTHYDAQLQRLADAGLDLFDRGRAVQDMVWSTSVQMRGLTPKVVRGALVERFGKDFDLNAITDRQLVESVQDYKTAHNETLFKSSPNNWPGLSRRARAERADLVELAGHEETLAQFNRGQSATPIDSQERVPLGPNRLLLEGRHDANASASRALEESVQRAVGILDTSLQRQADAASERMTLSLTKLALEHGFQRVDHVVLSDATTKLRSGENVFIVAGDIDSPTTRHAHMRTADVVAADPLVTRRDIDTLSASKEQQLLAVQERPMLQPEQSAALRMH